MSRVIVNPLNILGGAGGGDVTLFEDVLQRVDQPFVIGDEWVFMWNPNSATGITGTQMAACFNCSNANGLTITNATGGAFVPEGFLLPRPLSWARVQGRSQFAEYNVVSDNSVGGSLTRFGPMVLCNPNAGSWYSVSLAVEMPNQLFLSRNTSAGSTALGNTAVGAFAMGDEVTLGAEIVTGQVNLTVFVNDVSVLAVADAAAGRLTTGMPGIVSFGCSAGRNQVLRDFRAGILSRR